ncbi:hypothetical protein TNCV_2269811 [Trichonephila clavipes]|nr:hypothetical protein TNCV_2269811 [Trichonephila clavipes]
MTTEQRNARMVMSLKHLQSYHEEEYGFLSQIVIADDTWGRHFEPEKQAVEKRATSPPPKKSKTVHINSVVSYRMLKMEVNKEKIRYILHFFFEKGENAKQAAEFVNGTYGAYTVTVDHLPKIKRHHHMLHYAFNKEIKLKSSYSQGKSSETSVIALQTEEERASAKEKNRQRMTQTHAEGAAEQHAARLEDAHLRAQYSCFATSNPLCSQQKE